MGASYHLGLLTFSCAMVYNTQVTSTSECRYNISMHFELILSNQLHLVKYILIDCVNINVRSGVSRPVFLVAILQQRLYDCICVCLLLLATAATKQPPLVTKLLLTTSRHSDQLELLMSSTQDCSVLSLLMKM